jgi:parvulin-like peptidyl-prolyl isomerase
MFVAPFDEAVWSARLGVVLEPVASEFGFHVIEVVEEATTPATELSTAEQRDLAGAAFDTLLGEAVQAAEVVVVARLGEWDPTTGLILAPTTVGADRW